MFGWEETDVYDDTMAGLGAKKTKEERQAEQAAKLAQKVADIVAVADAAGRKVPPRVRALADKLSEAGKLPPPSPRAEATAAKIRTRPARVDPATRKAEAKAKQAARMAARQATRRAAQIKRADAKLAAKTKREERKQKRLNDGKLVSIKPEEENKIDAIQKYLTQLRVDNAKLKADIKAARAARKATKRAVVKSVRGLGQEYSEGEGDSPFEPGGPEIGSGDAGGTTGSGLPPITLPPPAEINPKLKKRCDRNPALPACVFLTMSQQTQQQLSMLMALILQMQDQNQQLVRELMDLLREGAGGTRFLQPGDDTGGQFIDTSGTSAGQPGAATITTGPTDDGGEPMPGGPEIGVEPGESPFVAPAAMMEEEQGPAGDAGYDEAGPSLPVRREEDVAFEEAGPAMEYGPEASAMPADAVEEEASFIPGGGAEEDAVYSEGDSGEQMFGLGALGRRGRPRGRRRCSCPT